MKLAMRMRCVRTRRLHLNYDDVNRDRCSPDSKAGYQGTNSQCTSNFLRLPRQRRTACEQCKSWYQ